MADIVSPKRRSEMMSGIRGKDTRPELLIRRALHSRGYRYRLHKKGIAGTPDLILAKYHAVIFVHGCFWHKHNCHLFKWPKTRTDFWANKLEGNARRDLQNQQTLRGANWRVCVIWECALKGKQRLPFVSVIDKLDQWLKSDSQALNIEGQAT